MLKVGWAQTTIFSVKDSQNIHFSSPVTIRCTNDFFFVWQAKFHKWFGVAYLPIHEVPIFQFLNLSNGM